MAGRRRRHQLPHPPATNYTYRLQAKDQIGTFTYFPSLALHRAAGGFGALNVYQRPRIPVPYPPPAGDFTLLVGDWVQGRPPPAQAEPRRRRPAPAARRPAH